MQLTIFHYFMYIHFVKQCCAFVAKIVQCYSMLHFAYTFCKLLVKSYLISVMVQEQKNAEFCYNFICFGVSLLAQLITI